MADDRIYLQCNVCGEKFFLGKQFAYGAFYLVDYAYENDTTKKTFIDRLNDFYEAHYHPCSDVCRWNGNYSVVYETDDWVEPNEIAIPFKRGKWCEDCKGTPVCEKNRMRRESDEEPKARNDRGFG